MTGDQVPPDESRIAAIERAIAVARGDEPADLVIKGGQVINVFSADLYEAAVVVSDGHLVGLGSYTARETIEASGPYVAPGFVDAHIHIESTLLPPREFARGVVPLGTTTVVAAPPEIADVLDLDGINYMIEASRGLPISVFFMLPSCVPASELETAGARLGARELSMCMSHPRVLARPAPEGPRPGRRRTLLPRRPVRRRWSSASGSSVPMTASDRNDFGFRQHENRGQPSKGTKRCATTLFIR